MRQIAKYLSIPQRERRPKQTRDLDNMFPLSKHKSSIHHRQQRRSNQQPSRSHVLVFFSLSLASHPSISFMTSIKEVFEFLLSSMAPGAKAVANALNEEWKDAWGEANNRRVLSSTFSKHKTSVEELLYFHSTFCFKSLYSRGFHSFPAKNPFVRRAWVLNDVLLTPREQPWKIKCSMFYESLEVTHVLSASKSKYFAAKDSRWWTSPKLFIVLSILSTTKKTRKGKKNL